MQVEFDSENGWFVKNQRNEYYFTDDLVSFGVDQHHTIDFTASNWYKISEEQFFKLLVKGKNKHVKSTTDK